MWNALKTMNESVFRERPLRVKRAIEKSKLEKKITRVTQKKMNKKGYTAPQVKKQWKVSQKTGKGGQGQGQGQSQGENGDDKSKARKFHFKRKMIKK